MGAKRDVLLTSLDVLCTTGNDPRCRCLIEPSGKIISTTKIPETSASTHLKVVPNTDMTRSLWIVLEALRAP